MIRGEDAHFCYFSKDAFAAMVKDNLYAANKRRIAIIPILYDGDGKETVPFDRIEKIFRDYL